MAFAANTGFAKFKRANTKIKNLMLFSQEFAADPQRDALNDLFRATGGLKSFPNGWKNKKNWGLAVKPLDEWYGVTTNEEGEVIELRLSFNHLRCEKDMELPLGLFERLPHLEVLDLHANRIRGKVPIDLALCSKLRVLSLHSNPDLLLPANAPMHHALGASYREDDFYAEANRGPTVKQFFKSLVKANAYRPPEPEHPETEDTASANDEPPAAASEESDTSLPKGAAAQLSQKLFSGVTSLKMALPGAKKGKPKRKVAPGDPGDPEDTEKPEVQPSEEA